MTEFEFDMELISRPMALEPTLLYAICALLHARGGTQVADPAAGPRGARRVDLASNARTADGVAVLPLFGILTRRAPGWLWPYATNSIAFANVFREALADPGVKSIVIEIDSSGGAVDAAQELGDLVFSAREQKPVYAIANSIAASAAYWIGSQAHRLFVTTGGQAGSIGVYASHEDVSRAMDAAGIMVSLIAAGKRKTEQSPFAPLSRDARAFMQTQVDEAYARFVGAVARGREVTETQVRNGMGQGRMLDAEGAFAANMVDGVVTLDRVVNRAAAIKWSGAYETRAAELDRLERPALLRAQAAARAAWMRRELDIIGS